MAEIRQSVSTRSALGIAGEACRTTKSHLQEITEDNREGVLFGKRTDAPREGTRPTGKAHRLAGVTRTFQRLTRTYRVASDGGKDQAVHLMVTKGVIPSFQGCLRRQEKSKITEVRIASDYCGRVAACARDHDPGVLDPLQCYNPCKHWCFPMFCPLHQTLQVATPVTNGGAASRNRTDARLRLVHVSRHRRKGSTPHPGPLLGRGGEGELSFGTSKPATDRQIKTSHPEGGLFITLL